MGESRSKLRAFAAGSIPLLPVFSFETFLGRNHA